MKTPRTTDGCRVSSDSAPSEAPPRRRVSRSAASPVVSAQAPGPAVSLAKLTRPNLTNVLPRERLFARLDQVRAAKVTWISAPPGAGKTTLLASYLDRRKLPCLWYQLDPGDGDVATFFYYLGLAGRRAAPRMRRSLPLFTPEHVGGLPAFSRRFFRELCTRLKPPCLLVFDNYQDVPADSRLHEALKEGLDEIPPGVQVAVLSRSDPPPELARHRANQSLALLRWDELRLTDEEAATLACLRGATKPTSAVVKRAQGWAAGLVLLLEGGSEAPADAQVSRAAPEAVFDYFAGEIFRRAERKTQDFLMESAFLPRMMPHTAVVLTAHREAERILDDLARSNYFTTRHEQPQRHYQYHPLFREFLLTRARDSYAEHRLAALRRDAARLLEESGMVEDAAELCRQILDWEGLARMALAQAPQFIRHGRVETVQRWLDALPASVMEASPWLHYWAGECRIMNDAPASRPYFERALARFREQQDATGVFLSWIRQVDTFRLDPTADMRLLDPWIDLFDGLIHEYPVFPSLEIDVGATVRMLLATIMRQPSNPAMRHWEKRAVALLQENLSALAKVELGAFLIIYHCMMGQHAQAMLELETVRAAAAAGEVPVLLRIYRFLGEALYYWMTCRFEENLAAVRAALDLANTTGAHVWDHELLAQGLFGTLSAGNLMVAKGLLEELGRRRPNWSRYHIFAAWHALMNGDLAVARTHAERSIKLAEQEGRPYFNVMPREGLAAVLWAFGERSDALEHLRWSDALGREIGSRWLIYGASFHAARYALEGGDQTAALGHLREAFTLGREFGFMNFALWRPEAMSRLCVEALQAGIELDYVRRLIKARKLAPPANCLDVEGWPWPVRVYTLGRFAIVIDGEPLRFAAKAQKKPLDLLKALVALGSRGVAVSVLVENLWPDLEGDAGQNAFSLALHRLRKLLGDEDALVLQEGRLSLDPRRVWVDGWAFERLAGKAEALVRRDSEEEPKAVEDLASRMLRLYLGHFLAEEQAPWTIAHRERLRSKFLRSGAALGARLEGAQQLEQATNLYRKALELDPLAEAFHCGLMRCLKRQGRVAEALDAYRRCQHILSVTLGVQPSSDTQAVYRALTS